MALEQVGMLSIAANSLQTMEISTGNPATVNDLYQSSYAISPVYGALNPLGAALYMSNVTGQRFKYRYVRLNSTTPPTLIVGPVYWKDETQTIVTAVFSEGQTGTANSIAGFLLNINATNGNYVFIQVMGPLTGITVPGSTAKGDVLTGASGATQTLARTAAGVAPVALPAGYALTAIASSVADVQVCVES